MQVHRRRVEYYYFHENILKLEYPYTLKLIYTTIELRLIRNENKLRKRKHMYRGF